MNPPPDSRPSSFSLYSIVPDRRSSIAPASGAMNPPPDSRSPPSHVQAAGGLPGLDPHSFEEAAPISSYTHHESQTRNVVHPGGHGQAHSNRRGENHLGAQESPHAQFMNQGGQVLREPSFQQILDVFEPQTLDNFQLATAGVMNSHHQPISHQNNHIIASNSRDTPRNHGPMQDNQGGYMRQYQNYVPIRSQNPQAARQNMFAQNSRGNRGASKGSRSQGAPKPPLGSISTAEIVLKAAFMDRPPTRKSSKGGWNEDEDDMLRVIVIEFQESNWKKIAKALNETLPGNTRNDVQCLHRWQKVLQPGLKKGPWTSKEDKTITTLVGQIGENKWSVIAKKLPGRIGKQCRERWFNHLHPNINHEPWTKEEEEILKKKHSEHGNKWALIAKFLPGRTDNSIKNHFNAKQRRSGNKKTGTKSKKRSNNKNGGGTNPALASTMSSSANISVPAQGNPIVSSPPGKRRKTGTESNRQIPSLQGNTMDWENASGDKSLTFSNPPRLGVLDTALNPMMPGSRESPPVMYRNIQPGNPSSFPSLTGHFPLPARTNSPLDRLPPIFTANNSGIPTSLLRGVSNSGAPNMAARQPFSTALGMAQANMPSSASNINPNTNSNEDGNVGVTVAMPSMGGNGTPSSK